MLELEYYIVGDLHRHWVILNDIISYVHANGYKGLILLGDLGLENEQHCQEMRETISIPKGFDIYAIFGNHDNPAYWGQEIIPHFHLVQSGTILTLANESVLFFGGAGSNDWLKRKKDIDWFTDEVPNYTTQCEFVQKMKDEQPIIDVVITHECPSDVPIHEDMGIILDETYPFIMRSFLQNVYDALEQKPRRWFFGHYHYAWIWSDQDTEFVCKDKIKDNQK